MREGREDLDAGVHQFGADRHRHQAADHAGDHREDQIERADVLVVGRIEVAAPAGRMVGRVVMRVIVQAASLADIRHSSKIGFDEAASRGGVLSAARHCGERRRRTGPAATAGEFLLRLRQPVGIVVLADHADGDRHVGVVLAADFRALAVIDSVALGLEPGLVQAAGHRVDADAEGRNGEGMDDVGGGDLDADLLADRHDRLVVDGQQPDVALGRVDLVVRLHQRIKAEAAALVLGIGVGPVPLVAGDLDGHVGLGNHQLMGRAGGRREWR